MNLRQMNFSRLGWAAFYVFNVAMIILETVLAVLLWS